MKDKSLYKKLSFIVPVIILLIISLFDMYASSSISLLYSSSFRKQVMWIIIGIIVFITLLKLDMKLVLKYINYIYILGVISLILVLFFGINVNGASSWFRVGNISIQPSELFKPFFIVFLCNYVSCSKDKNVIKLLKIILFTLIPSGLIFLEPDTGVVLMYILIMVSILLNSNIKKRYIVILLILSIILLSSFFILYFMYKDTFIQIFGTSFFYRIDRLISFKNNSSYQLNNALIGIGSSGITGIKGTKIYVPEFTTDFVFDLSIVNYGYLIGILIISLYTFFLYKLYKYKCNSKKDFNRLMLVSIFYLMTFQVFEHIFMNLGLTPITGITLPFLSYGGSSMISYFIIIAFIIKCI